MIIQLPIGLVGSNCYLVYDKGKGTGAVVDPGGDIQPVLDAIRENGLQIRYILNTHGHFDHSFSNAALKSALNVPLGIHPDDKDLLREGGGAPWFGMSAVSSPQPELALTEGLVLEVGSLHIQVIHTPGHTPGSICLYIPEDQALLTGDTLFPGSIGRTDLPGGDSERLMQSLRRLLSLPPQTTLYPGHGPATSLSQEMAHNPWLRALTP